MPSPLKERRQQQKSVFRAIYITLASLFFASLLGCGGSSGNTTLSGVVTGGTPIVQSGWNIDYPAYVLSKKKWTVLVYVNAANDLEEYGTLNVNQMEQVGSSTDVNIVVQFKRIKGMYDASDGDWGGTRRYLIFKDYDISHVSSQLLSDRATLNMGDPQTLQDFIQWGITTYPADHYCLVVWNHGAGWRSQTASASKAYQLSRGVSYDAEYVTNGYEAHIDTIQLPAAIDMGNGRKWDLLAWDASLMQMAEVAYEIRDKATYIVGSEESPPGTGFPYNTILGKLNGSPDMDGKTLGTTFAQEMLSSNGAGSNITESVLDCSKIAAVAPALDTLGSALTSATSTYSTAIGSARRTSEGYDYPENHDLQDFLLQLSTQGVTNDVGVASATTALSSAVSAAVVFNNHGSGHPRSNGLALFLPSRSEYQSIDVDQADGFGQRYINISLAKDAPHWQNLLATGLQ